MFRAKSPFDVETVCVAVVRKAIEIEYFQPHNSEELTQNLTAIGADTITQIECRTWSCN